MAVSALGVGAGGACWDDKIRNTAAPNKMITPSNIVVRGRMNLSPYHTKVV
jgi:hypothetical protein